MATLKLTCAAATLLIPLLMLGACNTPELTTPQDHEPASATDSHMDLEILLDAVKIYPLHSFELDSDSVRHSKPQSL